MRLYFFVLLLFFYTTTGCSSLPVITESVCDIAADICDYANAICAVSNKLSLESDKSNLKTHLYLLKEQLALYANSLNYPDRDLDSLSLLAFKFELYKIRESLKSANAEAKSYKQKIQKIPKEQ